MSCFSCFGENSSASQASGDENQPAADGNLPCTIPLSQIKKATKNFRRYSHIGNTGFAHVFKGSFQNGQTIAVKRFIPAANRDLDYNNEVYLLSRLNHPNIIDFIGFCANEVEEERIIIYEFMPLGTLYDHLHGRRTGRAVLNWDTRMRIAAGVATGLSYLHNVASPPIVYRGLKPTNVLLGYGFHPKISDFRVARFAWAVDRSRIVTSVVSMGTPPYWAPENLVHSEGYSFKSDVYSFGALLLEMIIGDVPLDPSSAGTVAHWVKIDDNLVNLVDPDMNQEFPEAMLKKAVNLALKCMNVNPASRPDMINVVRGMKHLSLGPHVEEDAEWPEEFAVVAT